MDEIKHTSVKTRRNEKVWAVWEACADITEDRVAFMVVRDITLLQAGNRGSVCWCFGMLSLGVYQNFVVEANVYSINLNPGKGISNWILFPQR